MCGSLETDVRLKEDEKPKMSFSTADYVEWGDFPKGLKVLLLDDDDIAAAEIKLRLEQMDYIVFLSHNEDEAIEAVANKTETFHVAIVEVNTCKSQERFRFLQMARGLIPTIMVSNVHCLSTMMKCIALGAAEFLQKPLSEDKLRNVWQHVVHKAFSAGPNFTSKSLQPIKETVASMLHLESVEAGPSETEENEQTPSETSDGDEDQENEHGDQVGSDRYPAPSTPQLEQGERLPDGGDCQDQANSPIDCAEEELNSVGDTKNDGCLASGGSHMPSSHSKCGGDTIERRASIHRRAGSKSNKRKMRASKVDWSPELHRRFVQAVEQLGIDRAIPSKILELMKVQGLTRHNVASHLQKYRMHRRHASPKDDGRRWPRHGDPRVYAQVRRPLVAYPAAAAVGHSVWGQPTCHSSGGIQPWARNGHQQWQRSPGIWPWKTFSRMHADAWGCPVVHRGNPFPTQVHRNLPPNHFFHVHEVHSRVPTNTYDLHVAEEVIDKVVKEAISKPWLPLPLGLKTPSTDTVLAELQRQGIRKIPIPPPSCR